MIIVNYRNRGLRMTRLWLMTVCVAGLALGQSLIVAPLQVTFNLPPGILNSSAQAVTVMPDLQTASTSVSFAVNTVGAPWLRVDSTNSGLIPNVTQAGVTLSVSVDTQGLVTGQSYNGFFTVQIPSVPSSEQVVNVSLFVGGTSALFAGPSSLSFSAVQGSTLGNPSSQNVTISSTAGQLSFSLTSQTQSGGSWLSLSSTGGVVGAPSGTFSVSVVPTGLTAGAYTGTITAHSTTTADLVQIPVTLTVTTSSTLSVAPATLAPFLYQIGAAVPAPQSLVVSSTGSPINFTVAESPGSVPWLVVNPQSGSANATGVAVSLSLSQSGLPTSTGTYTTNIVITPQGGTALAPIPVTLVVSNNPILQASPSALTYSAAFAGTNPTDQVVNVTVKGGPVGFTVTSDSSWLTVSASANSAPATLLVHANTTNLPVGAYAGILTLRPTNGDNYTIPIPVTLNLNNALQVTAAPSTLLFSFQTNQNPPAAQTFQVQSTGLPIGFTGTTTTNSCGSDWLKASASQNGTPATVTVQVFTAGFVPGLCTGILTINFAGSLQPLIVPVTVAVSIGAELSIGQPTPFGIEMVSQSSVGSIVITRSISLTSTDPNTPVNFNAFAITSSGGSWLTVGPGTGATPQNLVVSIVPGGLVPGVYGGQILISSSSLPSGLPNGEFVLPVTLTVNPNVSVTVSPAALSFTESQGGSAPANQSITLTSGGGTASYTATVTQVTGGAWLDVNPKSGNAVGQLTVSVQANSLPASSTAYMAQITLAFQNSSTPPITIPVSLMVTNPVTITAAPQSLSFGYQAGGVQPPAQKITVSNGTGPVQFSIGTTATPSGWLSVDTTSGTTPKDVNVSVNTQGLTAGTYNGSVTITAAGSATPAASVSVTLTVTAAQPPQATTVTSNASNLVGAIAPGELITIKGISLGPSSAPNGGLFTLNAQGTVNSTLDGVQVMFDNNPGTPIYVSPTQINVTAPWEITGRASTNIIVTYNGIPSAPIAVQVVAVAPALYSANSTGNGQAAAINQDGSYNGANGTPGAKAAPANTVISLYGTGGGITVPGGVTGSVSPSNQLLRITGPVSATIGGQTATVEFIGAAPGLVTGVMQINLLVPPGVTGNSLPVAITIDGVTSSAGPSVAVQ
jgi:trimeric autotransporter adhesin